MNIEKEIKKSSLTEDEIDSIILFLRWTKAFFDNFLNNNIKLKEIRTPAGICYFLSGFYCHDSLLKVKVQNLLEELSEQYKEKQGIDGYYHPWWFGLDRIGIKHRCDFLDEVIDLLNLQIQKNEHKK